MTDHDPLKNHEQGFMTLLIGNHLMPVCERCGAIVALTFRHEEDHAEQDRAIRNARDQERT